MLAPVPAACAATDARMPTNRATGDMEAQLRTLYTDRALLFARFGTADAEAVIALVGSLEAQLAVLYAERQAAFQAGERHVRTHPEPPATE